ncbi:MAG TPA: acyclic terpene utilization AtuA family protein, partial [Planctomycetes bacterium]|nr:acyclic terpene utilization AtuA family protein [Planctomycetota bacterium]
LARKKGIKGLKVGVIDGDDILTRIPELVKNGHAMKNMDDGRPLSEIQGTLLSANAYIGAFAVADCLAAGAQGQCRPGDVYGGHAVSFAQAVGRGLLPF